MDVRFQSAFEPLVMHSSKRDRRPFPKRPGASSPMFSPPFKGTMLCLGLETHHCFTGLCFRRNRTLSIAPEAPSVSYFLSPGAPRLRCFVANFVDEWLECWDFDKVSDKVFPKMLLGQTPAS